MPASYVGVSRSAPLSFPSLPAPVVGARDADRVSVSCHDRKLPAAIFGGGGRAAPVVVVRRKRRRTSCLKNKGDSEAELFHGASGEPAEAIHGMETEPDSSNLPPIRDEVIEVHDSQWTVPWTGETIVKVMLLWVAAFWFIGSWVVPILANAAGITKSSLTHRGQALYSLLTDVTEGIVGIIILHQSLARFRPLPPGWFKFALSGKWHIDVGLGCLLFPLVNILSSVNLSLMPATPSPPVVVVSSVEQSIVARDPVAMLLYAIVVSVCAPVWEEILFRGFLLPSLTRYMPLSWAVLASSIVFAVAHFNMQRLLPLLFLGLVMGTIFARSRNLLPPMLLHSLWNAFIFMDLMKH